MTGAAGQSPPSKVLFLQRAGRLALGAFGASFLAWAMLDPRFRDAEGSLAGTCCLPLAMGAALVILGLTVGNSSWRRFGLWLALALVGQAVALQLIDAGPRLHYQHYRLFDGSLDRSNLLILICLAVQTVLVAAGLKLRWPEIRAWLARTFRPWQLGVMGLFFLLPAAAVSAHVQVFVAELPFAAFVQAVNLGNILLVAWALPAEALSGLESRFGKLFGTPSDEGAAEPGGVDRFAVLAAVWVVLLTAALAAFSYERHPHVTDEVAYLLQARFFAHGVIAMPAPAVPGGFEFYLMEQKVDRWYPATPPAWPALLAVGVRLGIGWLVNPLLAGVNVLLTYVLVRQLYDRLTARFTLLLLCLSPWFIFMGMNFMTHTFTLTCALAAAVSVARARATGRALWACLGGAMVGLCSIIRPLDGLIVGVLLGLWVVGVGGRRLRLASIAGFAVGAVLVGSAVLPYNKALTGNPVVFPLNAYIDEHFGAGRNSLGFGPNRGFGWPLDPNPGHSPVDALINAELNSFSINVELLGWGTGSLLLVAFMLTAGRLRRSDYLMLAVCSVIFVAFFFYYYSGGPDFGARYWYLMLVPCLVLTTRGLQELRGKLATGEAELSSRGTRATAAVLVLCLLAVLNYLPWRAIDKYHHFWGMRPDIRQLAQEYGFGRSLVLIGGDSYPDYASAAIYNPLDLDAAVPVYAWDRSLEISKQLLAAYSDRPVWLVNGPSITGAGFQVVEGPLPASELTARDH
jgi:hypothetical protein